MKKLTRQRLWQLDHIRRGLCDTCSEKAVIGTKCALHWFVMVSYQKNRYRKSKGKTSSKYHCLSDMIHKDLMGPYKFRPETKKMILAKFGRAVDIGEFMGDT